MWRSSSLRFTSRLGLLLSVLGIAVGTGNIWRFPRIAASNAGDSGAGAFLLAWIVFLLLWSIPLIIAEYALGRKMRMGLVGTFAGTAGKGFAWVGAFVGFVATAILFYYSVVVGWCIYYFLTLSIGGLPLTLETSQSVWDSFQDGGRPVVFHGLAMALGALAVWKGVRSIERVNKILIPALLLIVVASLIRTLTLDGAMEGVAFLFSPDWGTLARPRLWLEALTQNAWDTGAGWGLILTYGAYMQSKHGVVKNALITGIGNNTVSLMAAVVIFGAVFAILGAEMTRPEVLTEMQKSGPAATGLTFIWMPQLFARMPAGSIFASLFFLGLSVAAFSSLIAMIELAVRIAVDMGVRRQNAILGICATSFALGIPSAIHLGFFENQDFVWGVALMISGVCVAFAVMRQGVRTFRLQDINTSARDWKIGRAWDFAIAWIVPVLAGMLLTWWLYQSATVYAPDTWFNPTSPYSVATCVLQWGLVMGVLIALNRQLVRRTWQSE